VASRGLDKNGVYVDFRSGDEDDLDLILVHDLAAQGIRPRIHTLEGVQTGTEIARLDQIYGKALTRTSINGEGGVQTAYVLFGPMGALIFIQSEDERGVKSVGSLVAVRGTTMQNINFGYGGC
jgi:hypothetical protein